MTETTLSLTTTRCFTHKTFSWESNRLLLLGDNGSGKSTILEALSYCCYLQSFRTSKQSEIAELGSDRFLISLSLVNEFNSLSIAAEWNNGKKSVLVNNKAVSSYRAIIDQYRVISLSEDDMKLIQGAPEERRSFIDTALLLHDPAHAERMRSFRKIVLQRNALLEMGSSSSHTAIWSEQLFALSHEVIQARKSLLARIELALKTVALELGDARAIELRYAPKHPEMLTSGTYEDFTAQLPELEMRELRVKRTLWGAHLDDIHIIFDGKESRLFSSRGQQKLLLVLLKIAQVRDLIRHAATEHLFFLIDDFITDFDSKRIREIARLLDTLPCSLVITAPHEIPELDIVAFTQQQM